jgi:hypothetical protein
MSSVALVGLGSEDHENQKQEDDLKERSTKKVKSSEHGFTSGSSMPIVYDDLGHGERAIEDQRPIFSYKDMVMETKKSDDLYEADEVDEEEELDTEGMKVVEGKIGDYDCPDFIFSTKEEKRIQKPWRKGVIVKMLGRKIGFKALENRLQQMWARSGVINIVDLGQDYYLVTFTSAADQDTALTEGPWLIYDHYLTVREWSANFHPGSEAIEKVAVWVRFSGLPIEYYDARILTFIGNRIGTTVKVDRNTLSRERGKYARLCVEVDLTKPVINVFN